MRYVLIKGGLVVTSLAIIAFLLSDNKNGRILKRSQDSDRLDINNKKFKSARIFDDVLNDISIRFLLLIGCASPYHCCLAKVRKDWEETISKSIEERDDLWREIKAKRALIKATMQVRAVVNAGRDVKLSRCCG